MILGIRLGHYRSRLDIIADILKVVSKNARRTHIMQRANLSHKLLQKYLAELSEASLIEFEPKKQSYVLTAKGQEFTDTYVKYRSTVRNLERWLHNVRVEKSALERLWSSESL